MPESKLLEFQKKVSAISKDSVNPFFHSKYFDVNTVIDTIKPILNEVGLVVVQPVGILGEKNVLLTKVYDGEQEVLSSQIILPEITDVQKFGATMTYFRRYALVSLLLLQGEDDDDGNSTPKPKTEKPVESAKTSEPQPLEANKFCSEHGDTVKYRPAGKTKQGKEYPGFWACSEKGEDGKFCKAEMLDKPTDDPFLIDLPQ